jgi:hypothetical protein
MGPARGHATGHRGRYPRELPNELRRRLDRVRPLDLSLDFASAIYLRSAVETIVRATSRTTWLDERTGDVLAEVFGKLVHIAVRYCPGFALDPRDIVAAAQRANWDDIVGLLVLTNATLSDSASNQAAAIRRTGAPIEVIHWFRCGRRRRLQAVTRTYRRLTAAKPRPP